MEYLGLQQQSTHCPSTSSSVFSFYGREAQPVAPNEAANYRLGEAFCTQSIQLGQSLVCQSAWDDTDQYRLLNLYVY